MYAAAAVAAPNLQNNQKRDDDRSVARTHNVPSIRCTLRKLVCVIRRTTFSFNVQKKTKYKTITYRANSRRHHDKELHASQLNDTHARTPNPNPLTEINAHSPRYSINVGRVASKNAGAARTAVAIPVLTAYLTS